MMAKNVEGRFFCLTIALAIVVQINISPASSQTLSPYFYDSICPKALSTIRYVVDQALDRKRDLGAALVRLHFHDCFVNGCDASDLLDDTPTFIGEKTAFPNINSLRGFEVIDEIKTAVDSVCQGSVVSCADILAVAARDSFDLLGGRFYQVLLGRRDARNASFDDANANLPSPFSSRSQLLASFEAQGLDWRDLVALSGAHTLGFAKCILMKNRIYNEPNFDPAYRPFIQRYCPLSGGDNNSVALDNSPTVADWSYFTNLRLFRGLLHSDQQLFLGDGSDIDTLARHYAFEPSDFYADFGKSMIKMGNIKPLTGQQGEIRKNCRRVNY